jgi:hypothetical protein
MAECLIELLLQMSQLDVTLPGGSVILASGALSACLFIHADHWLSFDAKSIMHRHVSSSHSSILSLPNM